MSRGRRGPLRRSNSMVTVELWRRAIARLQSSTGELESVKSGLSIEPGVYQGVFSSWNQDDQPTNWSVCGAPCAQEDHSGPDKCPKTGRHDFAQWREICTCLHVNITDEVKPQQISMDDADISCGRTLTLSCLLLEESKFLLRIPIQIYDLTETTQQITCGKN